MEYHRTIQLFRTPQPEAQFKVETTRNKWEFIGWMIEQFNSENRYIGRESDCVTYLLNRIIDIRFHHLLNSGLHCLRDDSGERMFIEDVKLLINSQETKKHVSCIVSWFRRLYYSAPVCNMMHIGHGFTAKDVWCAIFIYCAYHDYNRALSYLRTRNINGDINMFSSHKTALDCYIISEMGFTPQPVIDAFCYFYMQDKS